MAGDDGRRRASAVADGEVLAEKRAALEDRVAELGASGRLAVAFSAGVDSTLLLAVAHDVLGAGALALTVASPFVPVSDVDEARDFCRGRGIESVVIDFDPLSMEAIESNPRDRCYLCKREIMGRVRAAAAEHGATAFADGTNADDISGAVDRLGLRALEELGFASPLAEAGLAKRDVRALAREMGLPVWDKPAAACLATRFPYGTRLTREGLARVERAEALLREAGFSQVRVRDHGGLARIELLPREFPRLLDGDTARAIDADLRELGFSYATLDLGGFASGSMDRRIDAERTDA